MEYAKGTDEVTRVLRAAIRSGEISCKCPVIEGQPTSDRHLPWCSWTDAIRVIYERERTNEVRKA